MSRSQWLSVGEHVRVELLLGEKGEWKGLGSVAVHGVPLRDGARPAVYRIDTPDGILYTHYRLAGFRTRKNGAVDVALGASGVPWGRQEYMDEYIQPLVTVLPSLGGVEDRAILSLEPAALRLGGREWDGFSLSFRFESATRRIHRILSDGTWELGGSIEGNTVLSQSQCSRPVYRGRRRTLFTTTCLKTLEQYGSPQGVSYQLAPRGGMLQAFDFQHGPRGALLQYWPRFDAICSLVESPRGSHRLHVLDEYRFPLARRAATTPQHVLFTAGGPAEHEARDLWWDAYEHVYGGIRRAFRVRPTVVRPEGDPPNAGRCHEGRAQVNVAGEWVDAAEVPYAFAERVIPALARQGIRRIMGPHVTENDVSVLGLKRKLDDGMHGDHLCGSICCTHRFFPSDFWGGVKAWRCLHEKSRAAGIELGHWIAPHMSPRAAIFREHPDWLLTHVNTLTTAGGYWNASAVLDWNGGVYDWVLNDLRRWHDEAGLDYVFVDSWANLGLLQLNYACAMRSNWRPLARLVGALQKAGIRSVSFEGISPLGCSRFGLADLRRERRAAQGGIVGQNDFGWWHGEEDMAYNVCAHLVPQRRTEEDVQGILFRLMAARGGAILPSARDGRGRREDGRVRLNRVYEQVWPNMKRRRLLPDRAGVSWTDGKTQIVWAFKRAALSLPPGARVVERIEPDGPRAIARDGCLRAQPGNVYRLRAG